MELSLEECLVNLKKEIEDNLDTIDSDYCIKGRRKVFYSIVEVFEVELNQSKYYSLLQKLVDSSPFEFNSLWVTREQLNDISFGMIYGTFLFDEIYLYVTDSDEALFSIYEILDNGYLKNNNNRYRRYTLKEIHPLLRTLMENILPNKNLKDFLISEDFKELIKL